jgi:DNA-damage-inducible protein J
MAKEATVRARLEPHLKSETERLLHQLGLTSSQAISIFYRQILLRRGLPFDVALPNEKTRDVFKATDSGRNLVKAKNADEMFRKLGID